MKCYLVAELMYGVHIGQQLTVKLLYRKRFLIRLIVFHSSAHTIVCLLLAARKNLPTKLNRIERRNGTSSTSPQQPLHEGLIYLFIYLFIYHTTINNNRNKKKIGSRSSGMNGQRRTKHMPLTRNQ